MKRLFLALLLILLPTAALPQSGTSGYAPCAAGTIAVTATSANTQLSACGPIVILYNISSQEIFYLLGAASTTVAVAGSGSALAPATTNSASLPGNSSVVLNVNTQAWYLAAIAPSGDSSTLRIVQAYGSN